MRYLSLTVALLSVSLPAWAQSGASSLEKSVQAMQESNDRGAVEVSPPSPEVMQEKAEKFVKDMVSQDAAIGGARPEPVKIDERPSGPASAFSPGPGQPVVVSPAAGSGSGGGSGGSSLASSIGGPADKNTLSSAEPEQRPDKGTQAGEGPLPDTRKSKSAGIRTGQTAARAIRKAPGFVELN